VRNAGLCVCNLRIQMTSGNKLLGFSFFYSFLLMTQRIAFSLSFSTKINS